jgi:flagellar biosynthesis/type III secretory pathway protein FliH
MLSVEDMDGYDDLTEEQQDLAQEYFTLGYEDGYDEGFEMGLEDNSGYEDGRSAGFAEGMERERQRIYSVLDMQMKWAEQEGKGAEYLRWKNVKEYLTPVDLKPWTEEEWQEELAKDGF